MYWQSIIQLDIMQAAIVLDDIMRKEKPNID